jgi:hypothetical protein
VVKIDEVAVPKAAVYRYPVAEDQGEAEEEEVENNERIMQNLHGDKIKNFLIAMLTRRIFR